MCNGWGKKVVMGVTHSPIHQQQAGKETHCLAAFVWKKVVIIWRLRDLLSRFIYLWCPWVPNRGWNPWGSSLLPAPLPSQIMKRTVQGNCCCYGNPGRRAASKVFPEQTPGWAPAAGVRVQKLGSCRFHVPCSPKSRRDAVRDKATPLHHVWHYQHISAPAWMVLPYLFFPSCISYFIKGRY